MSDEKPRMIAPPPREGIRAMPPADLSEGDGHTLVGRLARAGEWTEIDSVTEGHFLERFPAGAFTKTFAENRDRIRVLFQHGKDPELGAKPIASVEELGEDGVGPHYRASLLDGLPALIVDGIRRGLYGTSHSFSVVREDWQPNPKPSATNPKGLPERTVKEAKVHEISVVTWPAYAGASVALRSMSDEFALNRLAADPARLSELITYVAPTAPSEPDAAAEPHLEPERREQAPPIEAPSVESPMPEYTSREEMASRVTELKNDLTRQAGEYPGVLPSEAQVRWDTDSAELEKIERDIAAWDSRQAFLERQAANPAATVPAYEPVNVIRTKAPADIFDKSAIWREARSEEHRDQLLRDYAMRGVEIATFGHPDADPDATRDSLARLLDHADSPDKELAQRVIDTGSPQYRAAFMRYLKTGERAGALLVQTDAQGGYAIPYYLDPTLVRTGAWTPINPYRSYCTVKQIVGTDTYMGASAAAVTIARQAEATASVEGGPAIGTISKVVSKVHAMVTLSIEMLEDKPDMVSEMISLIGEAKDTEEEAIFTVGAGDALGTSFNPTGLLAAHTVTAYCWTHRDTDVANTLDADDLFKHEAAVPIRHRVNAAWFMGRATIRAIQALETANGQLFGGIYGNVGQGPQMSSTGNTGLRLLQYPVIEVPSAVTGTAGDAVVAGFGDPKGFYIIDRVGMNLEVIPHLWAAASLPLGTRGIYAWWRNTSFVPNPDSGRRLAVKA